MRTKFSALEYFVCNQTPLPTIGSTRDRIVMSPPWSSSEVGPVASHPSGLEELLPLDESKFLQELATTQRDAWNRSDRQSLDLASLSGQTHQVWIAGLKSLQCSQPARQTSSDTLRRDSTGGDTLEGRTQSVNKLSQTRGAPKSLGRLSRLGALTTRSNQWSSKQVSCGM